MSRDDGFLYSGASSASFGTTHEQQVKTDKLEDKRDQRTKLKPSAIVVNEAIASEKRLITEQLIRLPIEMKTTDKAVKSTLLAIQMNLAFIDRFQNKINNILREPKLKEEPEDE